MLIDISDVLQICCYELGRTYLKLSQALCINLPSIGEYICISHKNRCQYSAEMLDQKMGEKSSIEKRKRPKFLVINVIYFYKNSAMQSRCSKMKFGHRV